MGIKGNEYLKVCQECSQLDCSMQIITQLRKLDNVKIYIEKWKSTDKACRQYMIPLSNFCIGHTRLTRGPQCQEMHKNQPGTTKELQFNIDLKSDTIKT